MLASSANCMLSSSANCSIPFVRFKKLLFVGTKIISNICFVVQSREVFEWPASLHCAVSLSYCHITNTGRALPCSGSVGSVYFKMYSFWFQHRYSGQVLLEWSTEGRRDGLLWARWTAMNFSTKWATVSFSRRTPLHGVSWSSKAKALISVEKFYKLSVSSLSSAGEALGSNDAVSWAVIPLKTDTRVSRLVHCLTESVPSFPCADYCPTLQTKSAGSSETSVHFCIND
jgi:hypothetical protein